MSKKFILTILFLIICLDSFNLGLIYPIFSTLIFESQGEIIALDASNFQKNFLFGILIAAFPFGQFLGAPIIGQLSDNFGRRLLLILSLIGTLLTLLACALGIFYSSLAILLANRFLGGLMAGNMTLAYASISDFSSPEEKVRNFALVPLAIGVGFASGPYLAGVLANPDTHIWAGPAIPFLAATFFTFINLLLVFWKYPETFAAQQKKSIDYISAFTSLFRNLQNSSLRAYLWILFLMISANLVFVQFLGPFAIASFGISVTEVGYLYANVGIAIGIGHLFLTRTLASYWSSEKALSISLLALAFLIILLMTSTHLIVLHVFTFLIMLACAVGYTNAMTLVSNQASQEQQGEMMGVAVSIQSCAEFLPAVVLGLVASISQMVPLCVAALFAVTSYCILYALSRRVAAVSK